MTPGTGTVIGASAPAAASARTTPPPGAHGDPFISKMVGNFRLDRRIGTGGMGAVYAGVHPIIGSRVAVKVLGGAFAVEKDIVDRFFAEARTLNQVAHQNIVKVLDLGAHPDGFYYCVMELLEGETLATIMLRGPVELARSLSILAQSADALAAAHEKGIIHRDLKPANIMLVKSPASGAEVSKLVDFGIAKLQSARQTHVTVTGTVIGTPAYMSPEQASGRVSEIDPRSDLYSLGLVAYELLTGHHPYEGRAVGELIVAQMTETPPAPSRFVSIPKRLDDLVMRLLKKRKDERPPSAAAVSAELRQIIESLNTPADPARVTPVPNQFPAPSTPERGLGPLPAALKPSFPVSIPPSSPPSIPPRREPTMSPNTSRIRTSPPRRKQKAGVRWGFIFMLAAAGAVAGAVLAGVVDAEPAIASVASAVGLAPPPAPKVQRAAPPSLDGTGAAFGAAPLLAECKDTFSKYRQVELPKSEDGLAPKLIEKYDAYNRFDDCVSARKSKLVAGTAWTASYVTGIAAYEFALALDRLPPPVRNAASNVKLAAANGRTTEMAPFRLELFTGQAMDRLGEARGQAPDVHKAYVDNFQIELDVLKQRTPPPSEGSPPATDGGSGK